MMNIDVWAAGPDISIPGCPRSSGTAGTVQSPVVASLAGRGFGCSPRCARSSIRDRFAIRRLISGEKRSCRKVRYPMNSGVRSSSAPSTGA